MLHFFRNGIGHIFIYKGVFVTSFHLQLIYRLPVSSDSRRVVNRRQAIETELGLTEDDIKKFSRPKVFLLPEQIEEIIS